ncbi:MAG: FAD-binding protein, partial [Rhodospirillales bacterium]|nr:FAD-binding protein [Rhodospirillales bacterium]
SFPRAGATLSLDFAHAGPETDALLADLHAICREAGGRVYAAKDASAPAACLSPGDAAMARFRPHVDPRFESDLWRRLAGPAQAG